MEGGLPRLTELPGLPSYPWRAYFSRISLENALKGLHGCLPTRELDANASCVFKTVFNAS